MSVERIGRGEDSSVDRVDEEQRRERMQFESKETRELTARRMEENRQTQSGEDRTTQAVTEASRHNNERGADWKAYADRQQLQVPPSVNELAKQNTSTVEQNREVERVGETEKSNQARNDVKQEALRKQAEQQMTVAEIQAELMRKSGLVRG